MEQLNNITELSELKKRMEVLEGKILKPELTDLQHIPLLYSWYKDIVAGIKDFPDEDKAEYKQVFLFCILMLYCPRALSDNFMIRGLRQRIAILFDLSPSHISNLINPISFYYKTYNVFKGNCDTVLAEIQFRIEAKILELIQR